MQFADELAKLMYEMNYPGKKFDHAASGPFGLKTIYLARAASVIAFFEQAGWSDINHKAEKILEFLTSEQVRG